MGKISFTWIELEHLTIKKDYFASLDEKFFFLFDSSYDSASVTCQFNLSMLSGALVNDVVISNLNGLLVG